MRAVRTSSATLGMIVVEVPAAITMKARVGQVSVEDAREALEGAPIIASERLGAPLVTADRQFARLAAAARGNAHLPGGAER